MIGVVVSTVWGRQSDLPEVDVPEKQRDLAGCRRDAQASAAG
jgi:hypothetical protein